MSIKAQHLAGFLNDALVKQVNKESWNQDDYDRPLVKIKRSKVNKNSVWYINFFKSSVSRYCKELMP